ncbi:immunoglobulin-like domain-containing protein [Blautia sp. MSJ-19]|uniref:immunoglobulin-like domain-containing protein n=1 Tax=Blautia sp. MSJ-19 TaxID=2841517 RepID=UPI001C0ED843|nr:immunoglobulin-like domain-containing protein [Blautia sp. MSJ-19]MBU5481904.1 DUF5011 domain-containing protein [Blautia sp. MSJ-19]
MSKKWIAFMVVVCVGLAGAVVTFRMNADRQGPEINFSDTAPTTYNADMNNAELLTGITATDDRDGDVSASLTVESVYEVSDSEVVITYTAKDNSNNITKVKRQLEVDASSKNALNSSNLGERTDEEESADSSEADNVDALSSEPVLSGTPTPTLEEDKAAQMKEEQEAEAAAMPAQNPKIYLTDYLVTVPVGTSVDLLSYVDNITDDVDDPYALWRKIQITGEVNSAIPGTYKCTYYVIDSQNNISNNAVLTVIVEK